MNGSGIPVIGMMPMVMPAFSKIWNTNSAMMPSAQQGAEVVAGELGRSPHAPHDDGQQRQQRRSPEEAELLADRGEDEVGVLLRNVAEPGLGALEQTLAR